MRDRHPVIGAVDIGATKTLVAVLPTVADPADLAGSGGFRRPLRFATQRDPTHQVDRVAASLRELASGRPIVAIGVAAPGPLDPASGLIVESPNLGWRDLPLGTALAERLSAPVAVEDDANAGALGEALAGAGRGADPVVYLTLSTGVGAGIVVAGRLVHGAHNAAGEVGHLVVDPSGPRCGCGGRGHVESYAGGAALAARARLAWPAGRRADGNPAPTDVAGIVEAAASGDVIAQRLLDEAVQAVAVAIAAVVASIDPERIVVGGSVGLKQSRLVRRAVQLARRRVTRGVGRSLAVVRAALGSNAPLVGAALLGRQRFAEASTVRRSSAAPTPSGD
jgi:glucokinase